MFAVCLTSWSLKETLQKYWKWGHVENHWLEVRMFISDHSLKESGTGQLSVRHGGRRGWDWAQEFPVQAAGVRQIFVNTPGMWGYREAGSLREPRGRETHLHTLLTHTRALVHMGHNTFKWAQLHTHTNPELHEYRGDCVSSYAVSLSVNCRLYTKCGIFKFLLSWEVPSFFCFK